MGKKKPVRQLTEQSFQGTTSHQNKQWNGKCHCTKTVKVYDHEYEHLSEGKVSPELIYRIYP